jgi:hypothetical protein
MGMSKQRVATSSAVGLLCSDTFRAPGEWEGLGVVLFFFLIEPLKVMVPERQRDQTHSYLAATSTRFWGAR